MARSQTEDVPPDETIPTFIQGESGFVDYDGDETGTCEESEGIEEFVNLRNG